MVLVRLPPLCFLLLRLLHFHFPLLPSQMPFVSILRHSSLFLLLLLAPCLFSHDTLLQDWRTLIRLQVEMVWAHRWMIGASSPPTPITFRPFLLLLPTPLPFRSPSTIPSRPTTVPVRIGTTPLTGVCCPPWPNVPLLSLLPPPPPPLQPQLCTQNGWTFTPRLAI